MAYYKTSDAGVLAAWKAYRESADRLQVLGEEFAKRFVGATALFQTSMHSGRNFYGLKFSPAMPQPMVRMISESCSAISMASYA